MGNWAPEAGGTAWPRLQGSGGTQLGRPQPLVVKKLYKNPLGELVRELKQILRKCAEKAWDTIKGSEAQLRHLEIPKHMHIEVLGCSIRALAK